MYKIVRELDIALMHSYANFGLVTLSVLEHFNCLSRAELEKDPKLTDPNKFKTLASVKVNCTWSSHTSQRFTTVMSADVNLQVNRCQK